MLSHEIHLLTASNAGSLTAGLLILALIRLVVRYFLRLETIPSVHAGLPVLGNLQQYTLDPVGFISTATTSYGECFTVPMLFGKTIWLRSPMLNKEYLETREVCT
jgi:sterol 14-demethylase